MDISKLKIGQKVWLTNEKVYGEVCGKTKSGWIRVMVSGTLKRVHISKIARVEPPKKKGVGDKGLIGPFDVLFDEEISDDILCQFDPVNEKMGVFSDTRTKLCQDVINEQKKRVFDIYKDESDYPGEIC